MAAAPKGRARIPKAFHIMGHTVHVKRIPRTKWKAGKDCVGYFDPQSMTIAICSSMAPSSQEQTFWHEVVHCVFFALSHDGYDNEELVDQIGGLLHQITTSMEH